jgi:16S rRNA (guanine527-N7)-methyltransferase
VYREPSNERFHVKHPDSEAADPEEIARKTRAIVEDSLRGLDFVAPGPHFLDRIGKLAAAIALWGGRINLTAEPEDATEVAFHIIDSAMALVLASRPEGFAVKDAFAPTNRVLDLGSGAGFPGLVLAAACDAQFTLLEARRKRASFLTVTAAGMGLRNVRIDSAHREASRLAPEFDTVTARAFAEPAIMYRSAAAALKSGGRLLLYANPRQRLDLEVAREAGLGDYARIDYELPRGGKPVHRVLAVWREL